MGSGSNYFENINLGIILISLGPMFSIYKVDRLLMGIWPKLFRHKLNWPIFNGLMAQIFENIYLIQISMDVWTKLFKKYQSGPFLMGLATNFVGFWPKLF